jgi:hypothetical protein
MKVKCFEPYKGVIVVEQEGERVYIIYEYEDIFDVPLPVLWLLKYYGEKGYMSVIRDQIVLLNRKTITGDIRAERVIKQYCSKVS